VAAAVKAGGVKVTGESEFGAAHKRRYVRYRKSSVIGQLKVVGGTAAALLLSSQGQGRAFAVIRARGSQRQLIADLVVQDGVKVVVQRRLDGGSQITSGPVEGSLFGAEGHGGGINAKFDTKVVLLVADNGVNVKLVSEVGCEVDVGLVVAPGELGLGERRQWHAADRDSKTSCDFCDFGVFIFASQSVFARCECGLELSTWYNCTVKLHLVTGRDGTAFESTLGGELVTIRLAGNLELEVLMLESLLEKIVALFGQVSVFDWHV